jgi:hypothetical protein
METVAALVEARDAPGATGDLWEPSRAGPFGGGRRVRRYWDKPSLHAQDGFGHGRRLHAAHVLVAVFEREQMVDDGLQLTFDMEHWNSIRSEGERIELPIDLAFDIELRRAAMNDEDHAAD